MNSSASKIPWDRVSHSIRWSKEISYLINLLINCSAGFYSFKQCDLSRPQATFGAMVLSSYLFPMDKELAFGLVKVFGLELALSHCTCVTLEK